MEFFRTIIITLFYYDVKYEVFWVELENIDTRISLQWIRLNKKHLLAYSILVFFILSQVNLIVKITVYNLDKT